MAPLSPCNRDRLACIQSAGTRSGGVGIQQRHQNADNSRFKRFLRHRSCRPGRRQDLKQSAVWASPPVSLLRQSLPAKIFHFTEIRKYRMCRPSRLTQEGRSCVVTFREPGLRWTRQRRAREAWAGRIALREPEASCRRAAL